MHVDINYIKHFLIFMNVLFFVVYLLAYISFICNHTLEGINKLTFGQQISLVWTHFDGIKHMIYILSIKTSTLNIHNSSLYQHVYTSRHLPNSFNLSKTLYTSPWALKQEIKPSKSAHWVPFPSPSLRFPILHIHHSRESFPSKCV